MMIDIFMPHMRGFESIRIFHERPPAIPLIAMSGYAFANLDSPAPDFLRMALERGAARCLRKPFTPMALPTVINECLAEASSSFAGVVGSSSPLRPRSSDFVVQASVALRGARAPHPLFRFCLP